MLEYLDYSLKDFLLFSPETYFRLVELYNHDHWPLQILGLLLGGFLIWLAFQSSLKKDRLIWAVLAGCWVWVGTAFYFGRYATINIAAPYLGGLFLAEALLLFLLGALAGWLPLTRNYSLSYWTGLGLVVYSLAIHPVSTGFTRSALSRIETLPLMPDPTLIATFGFILAARGNTRWFLIPIAFLLSAINGLTAWGLRDLAGLAVLLAASLALISMLIRRFKQDEPPGT